MHMRAHVCVPIMIWVMYKYINVYMCVFAYICGCEWVCACLYACMCVCVCACECGWVGVFVHAYVCVSVGGWVNLYKY